jgi:beta-phosphoglucomutase family hydrolase
VRDPAAASPQAVVFDMDGVLVDSGAHHRDAWRQLLGELGLTPAHDFWRLTIGRPGEEAVALLLGRPVDAEEAGRLARRKREHYARLTARGMVPIPGAPTFVTELARRGIPRAVATSASRHDMDAMLSGVGLRRHFDVIVTAEDVRRGKPDPEVYVRAAEGLGLAPGRCVVFEDSLVGVHAARSAGMRVIGVSSAHTDRELEAAGAERAIADFEGVTWPV